ncbi:cubilin [Holotrichia oblita]|uniref:Cubilin n=1 Tax=Holotrichia oblita TaxID=644536 RepID=A0ACB9SL92_HOLOL|nr:cubilin [Holotrichia oblita]
MVATNTVVAVDDAAVDSTSYLSFESFSVGTFESFTSEGCPDGYISIKEANRPPPGGKWCGSAWGYTVYYSETPSINVTLHLDRLSQQGTGYSFEFKISYKFLRLSDARIRYGNATQRSYRGKLHSGTYCDRLLESCLRRPCRIQSPNYPGIYPRNVSCHYRIREKNVPSGKHALIAVRQANYHYKEHVTKFDNSDRVFRIWDQCNMMQDYLEIMDGLDDKAPMLAHLCSGETVPEIVSSGPELLVKFHTSPYGNPFHPLPLSYLPGFELEVQVFLVNKESPTYIEHGKKCEFVLTTFDNSTGFLESPLHSLPPNTTCHYHFRGHPQEVVWISFIKYHVTNDRMGEFDTGECDVQLQLWDGDIKSKSNVPLMGQFCREDKPKLCDHSLLSNSSRKTRPCDISESYVSTGSDLTLAQTIKYGNVMYPVQFVLRYEFVDFSQEGLQTTMNPCDRIFKSTSGKFYSPRITFLYGRGGQRNLNCAYQFESEDKQKLELNFLKVGLGNKGCKTRFDKESHRWRCYYKNNSKGIAQIRIFEYPWQGVEILRDCICSEIHQPLTIITKTARKVVVNFLVTNMNITEDYNVYHFDGTFEFLPQTDNSCLNPWKTRRLKGSSGEITLRNTQKHGEHSLNHTTIYCTQQPWLIEPENAFNNFLYLKIRGGIVKNGSECPTRNRILVYSVGKTENLHVICPTARSADDVVELFSEGWGIFSYRNVQIKNSRSFIVEFLQHEPGNFVVTWMEVSKNPALTLPRSLLMISPPNCPHSCPELGACISPELWCDGLRHCPSGNDEEENNCSIPGGFPNNLLTASLFLAVTVTLIALASGASVCVWKHKKREKKNVIVSVTEHTFLEFKSGLC